MNPKRRKRVPKPRFVLKTTNSKEPQLILLTIHVATKRIRWSTAERVIPKEWNKTTQRVIERAGKTEPRRINNRLSKYATDALEIFYEWGLDKESGQKTFTAQAYKNELDYRAGFKERPSKSSDGIIETDFVAFCESVRDFRKDSTGAHNTWKSLNNKVNLLREFADYKHGGVVHFDKIDELFFDGFKKWSYRVKGHNRETVHKTFMTIRGLASRAADRGLMEYGKKFRSWTKIDYRKMPKPGLSRPELDAFIQLDLSDNERLERVRDLFLIGVATAQRWSDFSKLTPKNFKELPSGGYSYYIPSQRKTGSPSYGPVMSWCVPILRKYGYIGEQPFNPPTISGQKFNVNLKLVAKLAIPNSTTTIYSDREEVDHVGTEVLKHTVLSSHAARRTAISMLRAMRAPDDQILRMTGHKTIAQMGEYDVRDAEVMAISLGKDLEQAWSRQGLRRVD